MVATGTLGVLQLLSVALCFLFNHRVNDYASNFAFIACSGVVITPCVQASASWWIQDSNAIIDLRMDDSNHALMLLTTDMASLSLVFHHLQYHIDL